LVHRGTRIFFLEEISLKDIKEVEEITPDFFKAKKLKGLI
jgi:hypothetical protein